MKWIASFLDAIFANLFAENKFFVNIADKIAGSVEEFAYNVEAGNVNIGALSKTMERLLFWLPIVFCIFLVLDMFIRSRFVRYSYQDENQAKKSVWWRWQSDADAALALEAGAQDVPALTDGVQQAAQDAVQSVQDESVQDENVQNEEAETADAVQAPKQDVEAQQEAADVQAQEVEELDRGPVTSARQNQVRNVAPAAERAHDAMTDMRDNWTIFKGALSFAPRAIARNARLRKQRMKEEARHNRERFSERMHRVRAAKQRDEAAEAEALFDVQPQESYIDADYEANETVNTGGIEGYDFAHAAEVMQEAVQAQAEAEEAAAEEVTQTETPLADEEQPQESETQQEP